MIGWRLETVVSTGRMEIMNLTQEIAARITIIVIMIDSIAFYLLKRQIKTLTLPFAIGIIALTIIVLLINILYCLHRHGLL